MQFFRTLYDYNYQWFEFETVQTDRQIDRPTDLQTDIQTDKYTDRQIYRQTGGRTDGRTYRQTDSNYVPVSHHFLEWRLSGGHQ